MQEQHRLLSVDISVSDATNNVINEKTYQPIRLIVALQDGKSNLSQNHGAAPSHI